MPVPTQEWQRQFAISKIPQTNYATPTAGDANFKRVLDRTQNFVDEQPNVVNNRSYAKGQRQATESWIVDHDSSVSFDFDLCVQELGRWLLLAFGKVVTTQPDAIGSPTVYQHVFTSMDPTVSAQVPVTSVVEQCGSALDALFPSMACQSLSLKGQGPQRLGGTAQLMGSGKKNTPSGITIAQLAGLIYLYESFVGLTLDDGSTVMNAATAPQRLNSWEFGVQNTLDLADGFRPGAGAYQTPGTPSSGEVRSECLLTDQAFVAKYNLRLLSNSTFLAALKAQTPIVSIFDIVGDPIDGTYNNELKIKGYKAPYKTVKKTTANGLVVVDIESDVQYDTTASKDVEVTLINTVASYTS